MKNTMIRSLLGLLVLCVACKDKEVAVVPPPTTGEPTFNDHWTPADPTDRGPGTLDPAAVLDGKVARRMSVDQLRRSIPAMFAGDTWTVPIGRNQQVGFNVLSRTLGEPDYIEANAVNLDATPLFAKFMDDMAGDVCTKAIARDKTVAVAARSILRDTANIDVNLRYLRLKLHGIFVADTSMDGLTELRGLYDDIIAGGGDSDSAWSGVCVAMLTAPEFMAY